MADEDKGTPEENAKDDKTDVDSKDKTDEDASLEDLTEVAAILAHKDSDADAKAAAITALNDKAIGSEADRRVTQAQAKWAEDKKTVEEEAKRKAEEDSLEKNQEFQKLSETKQARITELEAELEAAKVGTDTETTRADEADKVLGKHVKTEIEALELGEEVTELLEGKSPVAQLKWLTKHRETLGKKSGERVPKSPNGDAKVAQTNEEREAEAAVTWK